MGVVTGLLAGGAIAANLWGAHKQSQAAKKAAEQQQQASNQALALQGQMYQQGRADRLPYMQQGGQGLTALTSLMGLPPSPAPGPTMGFPGPGQIPQYPGPGAPGQAVPRMPGTGGGGTVMLRAPTGQTQAVPAEAVQFYLSRGATRV